VIARTPNTVTSRAAAGPKAILPAAMDASAARWRQRPDHAAASGRCRRISSQVDQDGVGIGQRHVAVLQHRDFAEGVHAQERLFFVFAVFQVDRDVLMRQFSRFRNRCARWVWPESGMPYSFMMTPWLVDEASIGAHRPDKPDKTGIRVHLKCTIGHDRSQRHQPEPPDHLRRRRRGRLADGCRQRLGLAKSMVSKHMQLLEQEIGVGLLLRSTRKLSLTEAGRDFYEASRQLLQSAEQAIEQARTGRHSPQGTLRVASPIDYGVLVVAPLLSALRANIRR
jgi:hypothetical protein